MIRAILDVLHLGEVGAGLLDPLDVAFDGRVREYAEIQVEEGSTDDIPLPVDAKGPDEARVHHKYPEIGIQDDDGI